MSMCTLVCLYTCTCSCVNVLLDFIMSSLHHEFIPHSAHHVPNNLRSNSPLGLSPHSQPDSNSPDRRISNSSFTGRGSPLQQAARAASPRSPPPGADCPHPTRMNSLTHHTQPHSSSSLNPGNDSPGSYTPPTNPAIAPSGPLMSFQRTSSQPNVLFVGDKNSPNQRRHTISAEERIRLSLRVSACIVEVHSIVERWLRVDCEIEWPTIPFCYQFQPLPVNIENCVCLCICVGWSGGNTYKYMYTYYNYVYII